jgi:hypothetical protein
MGISCRTATAHKTNNSMTVLAELLCECMISQGLQCVCSPDLYPCGLYLWGTLKNKVYVNNPHLLQELKENIWQYFQDNSFAVSKHIFSRCEA